MMLTVGAPFTISADGVDTTVWSVPSSRVTRACQRSSRVAHLREHKAARSCGLFNIVEMPSYIDHLNIVPVGIGG